MSSLERILRLPLVRQVYAHRFERAFARNWVGAFRGVYSSFEEARASAPATKPIGYDNDDSAAMYPDRFERIVPADYPTMFWVDKALRAGSRSLFDFGGHVGISYYGFRRYLDYPDDLRWSVYDVPAVRVAGARIAREKGVERVLHFADSIGEASGCDILLAAGSLQYMERGSFAESLAQLAQKPRQILLNKTPLTSQPGFVTLQNIGTAFCPYTIFNDHELVSSIEALGYRVRDRWQNADILCRLPLTPERSVEAYSGVLFERV
jgi:putative methyltransferase (TIGR04325 family)